MRWAVAVIAIAACTPDFVDDTSLVTGPRLIAASVEPAEVAPGSPVTTTALWVDPTGTLVDAPLEWAFCTARKRFSEPGPVASACIVDVSPDLLVFGTGTTATGVVPAIACRQFGPDAPDPVPGEPAGRPADPDGTGGFYQPIRVRADEPTETYVLGDVRVRCGLPDATPAQASEFRAAYVPNANPAIEAVERTDRGTPIVPLEVDASASTTVTAGEPVDLAVHWPSCEGAPCAGSEPYLWFDPGTRSLAMRREAMRVSWYVTGGALDGAHSGRAEDEAGLAFAGARWTTPSLPGEVHVWAVLRDDRGGATWVTLRFVVE